MIDLSGINNLIKLIIFCLIVLLSTCVYLIVDKVKTNYNGVKTTTIPKITWELKPHGKTVDTVWVYKF